LLYNSLFNFFQRDSIFEARFECECVCFCCTELSEALVDPRLENARYKAGSVVDLLKASFDFSNKEQSAEASAGNPEEASEPSNATALPKPTALQPHDHKVNGCEVCGTARAPLVLAANDFSRELIYFKFVLKLLILN